MPQQQVTLGKPLPLRTMAVKQQVALVLLGYLQFCIALLSWKEN
jgi:hypothetical protein